MKFFFTLLLSCSFGLCFAQDQTVTFRDSSSVPKGYVNGIALADLPVRYALLDGGKAFSSTIQSDHLHIDYGQSGRNRDMQILDKNGESIGFNSLAGLLNFLDYNGWALLKLLQDPDSTAIIHLMLEKKGAHHDPCSP